MKALIIYVPENRFNTLIQILQENEVDGISYFNIVGQGKLEKKYSERKVKEFITQDKFAPPFARRTRVETIVPDSKVEKIINAIKQSGTYQGKIFISDISESHEI